jgi:phosphatidylinositol 3,5-bisphosphate 5-phosphatase
LQHLRQGHQRSSSIGGGNNVCDIASSTNNSENITKENNNEDDEGASSTSSSRTPITPKTTLRKRLKKIEAAARKGSDAKKQPQPERTQFDKTTAASEDILTTTPTTSSRPTSPMSLSSPPNQKSISESDPKSPSSYLSFPPPSPPSSRLSSLSQTPPIIDHATSSPTSKPSVATSSTRTSSKNMTQTTTPPNVVSQPLLPLSSSSNLSPKIIDTTKPPKTNRQSKAGHKKMAGRRTWSQTPSLDPYIGKLERYELFCTNQSYYLVGCNKQNSQYRVIKMDRTLIERPVDASAMEGLRQRRHQQQQVHLAASSANHASDTGLLAGTGGGNTASSATMNDNSHNSKPTLRKLSEFLVEDPNVYSQQEIQDMLDMIHDGNRLLREERNDNTGHSPTSNNTNNIVTTTQSNNGGGLKPIAKAYGIVGFIKFLDCYYLTLITRRAKVGSIGGNGIYTIKATETFPIKPAERVPGTQNGDLDIHADPSSVLLNMWNRGKRSVGLGLTNREIAELRYQGLYQVIDLTKNFFFSYTYDLTRSLQENFLANTCQPFPPPPFKDMFAWNFFLTRELENCTNTLSGFQWVMPIIHGAFVQRKLNDYGRSLNVILIARRSRHFAGTRYLKRGVSEQGKVANDVEHEQILHDESKAASNGVFSSYLQVRGSIPTYWTQESSVTMPKPPIELNRVDPTYTATQLHFEDLMKRYGSPIVVLDLVKQSEKREREVRVGNEFRHSIEYINTHIDDDDHKIRYCALDYSHISKHRHLDVSTSLNEVSTWAVNQTGFFCSSPEWKITKEGYVEPFNDKEYQSASLFPDKFGVPTFPMEQTGVLRTNCIE